MLFLGLHLSGETFEDIIHSGGKDGLIIPYLWLMKIIMHFRSFYTEFHKEVYLTASPLVSSFLLQSNMSLFLLCHCSLSVLLKRKTFTSFYSISSSMNLLNHLKLVNDSISWYLLFDAKALHCIYSLMLRLFVELLSFILFLLFFQELHNAQLAEKVRYKVDKNRLDDPHVKANLLFQVLSCCFSWLDQFFFWCLFHIYIR